MLQKLRMGHIELRNRIGRLRPVLSLMQSSVRCPFNEKKRTQFDKLTQISSILCDIDGYSNPPDHMLLSVPRREVQPSSNPTLTRHFPCRKGMVVHWTRSNNACRIVLASGHVLISYFCCSTQVNAESPAHNSSIWLSGYTKL